MGGKYLEKIVLKCPHCGHPLKVKYVKDPFEIIYTCEHCKGDWEWTDWTEYFASLEKKFNPSKKGSVLHESKGKV